MKTLAISRLARVRNGNMVHRSTRERATIAGRCRRHRGLSVALLVIVHVAVCGCGRSGPQSCTVSGRVSCDGEPLSGQEIVFEPVSGDFAPGAAIIKNGTFTLRVAAGQSRVQINGILRREPLPQAQPVDVIPGVPNVATERVIAIPSRYNTESVLTADVKKSGDTFTFELESAPPKKR